MSWNYRVVKKDGYLGIHEVYYNDDAIPESCTVNPVKITEENLDELKHTILLLDKATQKEILNYEGIVK